MTLQIGLSPETEAHLLERATAAGKDPVAYVLDAVHEKLAREPRGNGSASADEWIARWRAWAAGHRPVATLVDDSRESIYAGRGE